MTLDANVNLYQQNRQLKLLDHLTKQLRNMTNSHIFQHIRVLTHDKGNGEEIWARLKC